MGKWLRRVFLAGYFLYLLDHMNPNVNKVMAYSLILGFAICFFLLELLWEYQTWVNKQVLRWIEWQKTKIRDKENKR
jgi:hypothetical protein